MKPISRRFAGRCLSRSLLMASLGAMSLGAWPALAQLGPPPGPTIKTTAAQGGLNAADQRVAIELTNRGMDKLLQYFLDKHHVSAQDQKAIRFSSSWMELTTDAFNNLSPAKQQERINDIVAVIGKNLASMHDPTQLINQASALISSKEKTRYVNTLEYWGENPKTQSGPQSHRRGGRQNPHPGGRRCQG